ncbi:carboxypeptidase regulatory-like domain-containing protein [Agromyces sp. NPDC057865]|uniref:carboxypeptidase regulatory-like domain-containing protein n=1 Tax=Agromyces sp. NPDC057865 TaxID=3346267 RepID=UPI003670C030
MTRTVTRIPSRHRTTHRRMLVSFLTVAATVLASLSLTAAPAVAAPQNVSGTVSFGTDGNHPEGVTAVVTWQKYVTNHYVAGPAEGVRTDAEGRYSLSFEPGTYKLRFTPSSSEYQAVWWGGVASQYSATVVQVGSAAISDMDITVPPRGSLSGRVFLGNTDTPAGEGDVRAIATACLEGACSTIPSVSTDAAGRYSFTGLAHGDYTVQFEYVRGQEFQGPLAPVTATINTASLDVSGKDVVLPASASISGRVVLGPDRVPAGADVVVTARRYATGTEEWTDTSVRTEPDGSYSFAALQRGRYDLRFDYQGAGGYVDQWWPGKAVPTPATSFALGEEPLTRDVVLPVGGSIAGTVRNQDGVPIANAKVTATAYDPEYWTSGELGSVVTAPDGSYVLTTLPPAVYYLEVTADGYARTWIPYEINLAEAEQRTGVDAAMPRYRSISGSITCDRCDEPEVGDNLYVQFERNVGTRAAPVWVYLGTVLATPTDAVDGAAEYTFSTEDGLVPGIIRATVGGHWGWRTRANLSPAVTVADGAKVTLDLAVELLKFDRDFSGDELPDVLVRNSAGAMLMYTGDGEAGWKGVSTIGSGWTVMNHVFAAGDFSGDGHEDVMARDAAGRLHLYRGDGKGGWLGWGVVGTGWGHMTSIFSPGDFSGDGNADVMARDAAGDLWLYPGDGKGGWGAVSKVGSGWNIFDTVFAAGDFGGYGEANVMGRMPNGDLWVYQASGYGGWMSQYRAGIGWNMFDAVFGAGDFDGDGWDDIMGRDRSGNLHLYPGYGGLFKLPSVVGTGWGHLSFVS